MAMVSAAVLLETHVAKCSVPRGDLRGDWVLANVLAVLCYEPIGDNQVVIANFSRRCDFTSRNRT